ncbi:HypC/HybG/HupF family hydrogenase formation chaperone [Streptomyces sp. NBC_00237]|uniref:HypC/HybG/HupF family hydrogenase formation chaperone n=1 Tax=Streptomyces sp. NBC_00237 TaxID=2975687 RepID=UPI00224D7928|nr:HypC/HybG/HupF family hydrogenase formation chaperone [Streptomyces sp. NBC_00237]MCX5205786.1 HypC/HybG/HupF family hydrogenase formation chaperone [Streptomyces sp. NBC_00237]
MCLGIPGRVLDTYDSDGLRMATVDFGGVRRPVCLAYTPGADVGTYVIVHVGFAITEVDEQEARRTLEVLRAMAGAVETELGERLPGPPGEGRSAPEEAPGQPLGDSRRAADAPRVNLPTGGPR